MTTLDTILTLAVAGGIARVYKLGEVPHSPTYPYAVLSPADNAPVVRDLGGSGDPVRRFAVQVHGRTEAAVTDLTGRLFAAFDARALTGVAGEPVAALEVASGPFRDPDDDGVLSATHIYRY